MQVGVLEYVKQKLNYNKKVDKLFGNEFYRKLKWFSYLNKRRHEDTLINQIKYHYGEDIIRSFSSS